MHLIFTLNKVHNFLEKEENAEDFCTNFDFGIVVKHHRSLFLKEPVWWLDKSIFVAGMRVGLPAEIKPFLWVLCFKLSNSKIQNAYSIKPSVFICEHFGGKK